MPEQLIWLFASLALVGCGDDRPYAPIEPVSSMPPPGLDTGGAPLFDLDTTTAEIEAPLVGAPSGFALVGKLRSPGGLRELVLRTPMGDEVIAPAGWTVLATGAFASEARGVVCWNVLVGAPSPSGGMPHPSEGLALRCRFRNTTFGASQEIADHEWLVELTGTSPFALVTYRDATGWLFMFEPGDGHARRESSDDTFGPAISIRR